MTTSSPPPQVRDSSTQYRDSVITPGQTKTLIEYIDECTKQGKEVRFNWKGLSYLIRTKHPFRMFEHYVQLVEQKVIPKPWNHDEICAQAQIDINKGGARSTSVRQEYRPTIADALNSLTYLQHQKSPEADMYELYSTATKLATQHELKTTDPIQVMQCIQQKYQELGTQFEQLLEKSNFRQMNEKNETISKLTRTIEDLTNEKETLSRNLEKETNTNSDARMEIFALQQKVEELNISAKATEKRKTELESELSSLQSQIKEIEEMKTEMRRLSKENEKCHKNWDALLSSKNKYKHQKEILDKTLKDVTSENEGLRRQLDELTEKNKEIEALSERRKSKLISVKSIMSEFIKTGDSPEE